MSRQIQILKNGVLKKTLELENGTYSLGRSPDADIVLADNAVSKTHAMLSIDNDRIIIKDSDSANGIFFQGQKIAEKPFENNFEIEIRPFTLRSTAAGSPDTEDAATAKKADTVRNLSINNIKISIFLLFGITMLLTVIIGYFPLKQKTASIARQETLKNGILLTRYLAEMNRPFLADEQHTLVRTSPVRMEDGVVYAYVVDSHGRIIAPREKQGDFVDWSGLSSAFAEAKLRVEDGKQNEKIIFYPLIQQNRTLGAAILGFAWQHTGNSSASGMGALAVSLIAILFAVAFFMAHLLARAFLNPLKSLYEEVEIAIKNGNISLDFKAPYAELENIKRAFDRLLARKNTSPSADVPGSTPSINVPASKIRIPTEKSTSGSETGPVPSPTGVLKDNSLQEVKTPWCVIDRENYTLLRFSDNFAPGLGTKDCRAGMHIIEALEADIIPAVSQVIDSDHAEAQTLICGEKTYKLKRITAENENNTATLVFEDTVE